MKTIHPASPARLRRLPGRVVATAAAWLVAALTALPLLGWSQTAAPPPHQAAPELVAKEPPRTLDARTRAAIVDSISAALNEVYVFADVAKNMEKHVRARMKKGAYDKLTSLQEFTAALTDDLRSISKDLHLHVDVLGPDALQQPEQPTPEQRRERRQREAARMARDNYGFRKVERLDGNVGYLRLDGFMPAEAAGATAVAAMNFLANCDALIIDLRANGGGSPSMIQLITSYLFEEPVHLNDFYIRREDKTQQFWTAAHVEGRRMPDTPVYVLTSERTFSAAEEFSYNLKNLERATLVGEKTGGGAHPVDFYIYPELGVGISLPFGRAVNPISGTNWEGVGVAPDIEVPAAQALDVAHRDALEKLVASAHDPQEAAPARWALDGVRARTQPYLGSVAALSRYAGHYADRRIVAQDGELYYQRGERSRMRMIPMSETLFRFEEMDGFRLQVVLDDQGAPVKLVGLYAQGHQDESPRTAD